MDKLNFATIVKLIRTNRNLTIRGFADITKLSPAYICDLEQGYRKSTLQTAKNISERLNLSPEENKLLIESFHREHLSLPEDLIYYLIDNDLLDSLNILKEKDKDGSNIKTLALNLNQKNI